MAGPHEAGRERRGGAPPSGHGSDSPAPEEAVLLATHFQSPVVRELLEELREECPGRDVFLLFDSSSAPPPKDVPATRLHSFSDETLWSDLGVPRPGGRFPTFFPGNVQAAVLHFALHYPGYARYWFVENDVRFTGPWHVLLDHFSESFSDLLATTLIRFPTRPDWRQWNGVRRKGRDVPREELIGSFNPVVRLSSRACEALGEAYRERWEGHAECVLPTVLTKAGLTIEDIGGSGEFVMEGNQNRFYWNTPDAPGLAPGSFVYRPHVGKPGQRPLTLWHPVKPAGAPRPWEAQYGSPRHRLKNAAVSLLKRMRRPR